MLSGLLENIREVIKMLKVVGFLLFAIPFPGFTQHKIQEIPAPTGYQRIETESGSFASYLRNLELKNESTVYLFDGSPKAYQGAQYAVIDMDVGNRDLQQCADAVMRLKAEYHYQNDQYENIHFNFTNGDRVDFVQYAKGYRPKVSGNHVSWNKTASEDFSYPAFRKYLTLIFSYAGSYSLSREMIPVSQVQELDIGQVFIQGGFPGHAIIVVDLAENSQGKKVFMLAQSYMPAQDIHILKNPRNAGLSPWYSIEDGEVLFTPEWKFHSDDLKRFR